MKKHIKILAGLIGFFFAVALFPAMGAYELLHANFDDATTYVVCPDWTSYYNGSGSGTRSWYRESTLVHTAGGNAQAVKWQNNPNTAGYYQGVYQDIQCSGGDAFTISAWLRNAQNSTYNTSNLRVQWDGTGNRPATTLGSLGVRDAYTKLSGSGNATGAGSTSVRIFLENLSVKSGTMVLYADDVVAYHAYVPAAPTVALADSTSLDVTVNKNANDAEGNAQQYAITIGGGSYTLGTSWVQADGTVGGTAVWQTRVAWGTVTIGGLTTGQQYDFKVKARYSSTVPQETSLSAQASGTPSGGGGPKNLAWGTDSDNWTAADVWYDTDASGNATFSDNDVVALDDSHSGTTDDPIIITLSDSVTPGSLTMTADSKNFEISGSGGNGMSGAMVLAKQGAGALTLGRANAYSGGTTLSAGQLNINDGGSGGTSSSIGTGALTITGGTIDNTSSGAVTLSPNNALNWNGDFTFAGSNPLNLGTGAVTPNANRQITVSASELTVGGIIGGGAKSLTKAGAGTLTLSGHNTFSGGMTLNAGQLNINYGASGDGSSSAIGTGTFTINGGTVDVTAAGNVTIGVATLPVVMNGDFSFLATKTLAFKSGSTFTLGNNVKVTVGGDGSSTYLIFNGIVGDGAGSYKITKDGPGFLILYNANTFEGGVKHSGGVLGIYNNTAIGTGTLDIAADGSGSCVIRPGLSALTFDNNNVQLWNGDFSYPGEGAVDADFGTGSVTLGGNRQVTVSAKKLTVGGAIGDGSNGYGLTKAGAGTLSLGGTSTYTGNTAVNEGMLVLSGSVAGDASVASGATLKGAGTIGGDLTVGGKVAPGGSVGTLTVSGNGTWATGGSYDWEIENAGGTTPGTDWDLIDAGDNTLDVAASSGGFTLTLLGTGTVSGKANNFDPDTTKSFQVAASTDVQNFLAGDFTIVDSGLLNDLKGGVFSVESDTSGINLKFTANHAPTASNADYVRKKGTAIKIKVADLLADKTADDDGHSRSLVNAGVDTAPTKGSLTVSGGYIYYTPTDLNNTDADSFSYKVDDAGTGTPAPYREGDTIRTATATINLTVENSIGTVTITEEAGSVTLTFYGIPTYSYVVQKATDLGGPWSDFGDPIEAASNGLVQKSDNPGVTTYYRIRSN